MNFAIWTVGDQASKPDVLSPFSDIVTELSPETGERLHHARGVRHELN